MTRNNQKAIKMRSDNTMGYQFLGSINRVIRKQMDAIIEMTRLTLRTGLDKEQRGYLESAMISANELVSFLNEVVDFSNIKAHQVKLENIDFELHNTLDHAAEAMAKEVKSGGHKINWDVAPDVPTFLTGDPGRLRQIIVNLTRNTLLFVNEEALTIHLKTGKKEDTSISLHFTISGIGTGVSRKEVAAVFASFRPLEDFTPQEYGSRALGFSLSMCLVKMMGGRIWLENDPNNASSLHFTARFGLRQTKDGKPPDLVELNLSGVPVLIVDDNEINRLVFKEMISSKGVMPAEAANGEEAIIKIDKAFSAGKPYRLILLDLQMQGGMDGFEVARKIKERPFGTGTEIILLTSVGQKGDTAKCREVGISGYLLKPVGQSELLDAIAMAFSQPSGEKTSIITRYTIQEVRRKLERPFTVK